MAEDAVKILGFLFAGLGVIYLLTNAGNPAAPAQTWIVGGVVTLIGVGILLLRR